MLQIIINILDTTKSICFTVLTSHPIIIVTLHSDFEIVIYLFVDFAMLIKKL